MPGQSLPTPEPPGDSFTGFVLQLDDVQILALEHLSGSAVIARGDFIVRYAIHYAGPAHLSIVPGLVVMDYGETMTGDEAWHFLLKGSNLYPRAEVIGYRSDGKEDMPFVKQLDLALPVEVFVYADDAATTPLANPTALIAPEEADVAPRIREYLPSFTTLAEWQASDE
ncbi:MAG: hypothetical protein D6737_15800 [Chloroflexi bacterium]|nr:MAG: hypothetical protein CUN54_00990 [Phototrophicales bacterium]RMF78147.1 MAG: hypothetical protein D6737_15800 [Chloroflexota bacterium]